MFCCESCSKCKLNTKHKPMPLTYPIRQGTTRKAGGIITTPNCDSVLLVQSYSHKWGFPKGHCEDGESYYETAQREILEETGIHISVEELKRSEVYKTPYDYVYYRIYLDRDKAESEAGSDNEWDVSKLGSDITGIGWFHLECLKGLNLSLNCDAKRLIEACL